MTKPLTKEQRAEMRSWIDESYVFIPAAYRERFRDLLDSHALVDEALDFATAKLATAEVCECVYDDSWKTSQDVVTGACVYNKKCPNCTNGVVYSDERAEAILNRLKELERLHG